VLTNPGGIGSTEWVDTAETPASLADRWILSRFNRTALSVNKAIEEYRFHEAASDLYHFIWDEFCSWYIELSKPLVASQDLGPEAEAARSRIAHVLEATLRLLAPFMPYITEEIWQLLPHPGPTVHLTAYPAGAEALVDPAVEAEMGYVLDLITKVRNIRSEMNVPSKPLRLYVATADGRVAARVRANAADVGRLARLEALEVVDRMPELGLAARAVLPGAELAVPLEGIIDVEVERKRLMKELEKARNERAPLAKKLENPSFVERAAADVVEATRARVAELDATIARLEELVASMR
jgi:valyl-tRNA synthetase